MRLPQFLGVCFSIVMVVILLTLVFVLPNSHKHFTFQSKNEEHRFYERLKWHGLDYDISVIYEGEKGLYFMRDGKKCKF